MPVTKRAFLLLLVAAIAAVWRSCEAPRPTLFLTPARGGPAPPLNSCLTVDLPQKVASAHASSVVSLADGSVLLAWFAGSREGAADVTIEMAQVRGGVVVERWKALDRAELEDLSNRAIRKLGNPVIWLDQHERLHMAVVSVSIGGWSGSSVNHLVSDNFGRGWLWGSRLILSPLFNLSTLMRTPPVAMSDGSIGLPCYHELLHKHSLWVRLDATGRVRAVESIYSDDDSLQPAIAALDAKRALALMRSPSGSGRQVLSARSADAGRSWQPYPPIQIPNPDSSVALLRLGDGTLLLTANPLENGRGVLQLFLSSDSGASWKPGRIVEGGAAEGSSPALAGSGASEYSYPALALGNGGTIHLSYTFERTRIRLRSFDRAWAEAAP